MKIALVGAVFCFASATQAFGQQVSEFSIIIEGAGLSMDLSDLPSAVEAERVWGGRAGLAFRFGRTLYVEPGVGVAGSGYRVSATVVEDGLETRLEDDLGHAGVRVHIRGGVRFLPESPFNVRVFAGLAPIILTIVADDNDFEIEKDDYNSAIWSAEFGGGLDFYFLTLSAFYETGLSNLFTEEVTELASSDIRANGVGGSVGLRFRI